MADDKRYEHEEHEFSTRGAMTGLRDRPAGERQER